MTGKERITRILNHQPVDRIAVFEKLWGETHTRWIQEGHLAANESVADHFSYDMDEAWEFNLQLDMDFKPEIICEDEDTVTTKDQNYATLRRHKNRSGTPEHIAYDIIDKESWDQVKHLLKPDRRRINYEYYREIRNRCIEKDRFLALGCISVFECMSRLCGHENLLVGMALEPEWIAEMTEIYSDLLNELLKMLFAEEGLPDGIWIYEDLGFKERPFMSPEMYRELIMPGHKKVVDFAHSLGLPIFMHSCGFIEPLLPDIVDLGIDCLTAMEIKAGMDLNRIYRNYGDRIAFMGGLDVRTLSSNDRSLIDRELTNKIPEVMQNNGYILCSDHSIPHNVDYETYRYFIRKGLELGTYPDFKG